MVMMFMILLTLSTTYLYQWHRASIISGLCVCRWDSYPCCYLLLVVYILCIRRRAWTIIIRLWFSFALILYYIILILILILTIFIFVIIITASLWFYIFFYIIILFLIIYSHFAYSSHIFFYYLWIRIYKLSRLWFL